MALNISAWSIRQPLPSVVFSIILLILGWMSFNKLAITRLPSADIPVISVAVAQFGAAPSELESQVTKIIEDGVSGVENVRQIASSITDGLSVTTITFSLETNTDRALNDIKDAVTRIRSNLPQNINEPLISRVDVVASPILTYAAISPGKTPEQLSWFVDDVVKRALQGIRGVSLVERVGGVEREILVSLDPDRLQAVGLTALDVSRRLRGSNVDVAGGRAEIGQNDQAIRTLAGARTLNDLAGTMISLPNGGEARLDDLGTVTDTIADRRTFARFNGEPVVALSINRSKGASEVVVAKAVQKRIDELKAAHPEVDLQLIDTTVEYTKGNYEAAIHTLFEGAALAVIVVFIFLRDLRATVIAAVSLPLSIFPAFWVMDLLGFSLNLVSFLAITLSTGILVDDAIVEIENIVRHMRMGKSPYRAAIDAADEIGLAVIAISLTIIAIFAPASFMPGIAGQFFKQFGITVSVQVFFSLLAARLVTPLLAAYFMKPHHHEDPPPGFILRGYNRLVRWSARNYYLTVLIGLCVFAASVWSLSILPGGLLPAEDYSRSRLVIELPPGALLSTTEKTTEDIVERLRKRSEVESVFVDGGRAPQSSNETRRATLTINYTPKGGAWARLTGSARMPQAELEVAIGEDLENVPDIRYWFLDDKGLRAISLSLTGPEIGLVNQVANELVLQMKRIPQIANVTSGTALDRPELRVQPRADLAARLGVSTEGLSETVRVATIGDVTPALAKFDAGERQIPIRVQFDESARSNLKILEQLRVPFGGGRGNVPLSVVADIRLDQGPTSINRFNRQRQATVAADLAGKASLGDVLAKIDELPIMKSKPRSVTISAGADAETMKELADGFTPVIVAGLLMVYAVLVLLFGTFLQPITILFSLPLSIGGAVMVLLLTGEQKTIPVYIGIMMLMGIVTKNAIMLVDFAIESIHAGMPRDEAIIDAGMKRARPITMTTIAMAAGMVPSALAFGAGGEFRSPMALAVISGLMFSTVLSLVFVPAVFLLMDDLGGFFARIGRKIISSSADANDPPPADHGGTQAPPTADTPPAAVAPPAAAAAAATSH